MVAGRVLDMRRGEVRAGLRNGSGAPGVAEDVLCRVEGNDIEHTGVPPRTCFAVL